MKTRTKKVWAALMGATQLAAFPFWLAVAIIVFAPRKA